MQFYVKDIMSTELVSVKEDATIKDLIQIFAENEISGVPVLDKEGYVSGVVTSADILKNENSYTFYNEPFAINIESSLFEDSKFFEKPVSGIMSKDLYVIDPNESVAKMASIMYNKKIHRLLVTEYNKLVGVVSTYDLLKLLASGDEEVVV